MRYRYIGAPPQLRKCRPTTTFEGTRASIRTSTIRESLMQITSIKNQADKSYVAEQYADTKRLDARIRLYDDFRDPRDPSLTSWVFAGLGLQPGMRVLE